MTRFLSRIVRAAALDAAVYEEIEADRSALPQATAVVLLSSVAAGFGVIFTSGPWELVIGTLATLFGWYVWAALAYVIGAKVLPAPQTEADLGQLLRVTGFSSAPGILRVLGILPLIDWIVYVVTGIWMLVAMVVAIRQALDYPSIWQAVAVAVLGWAIYLACGLVLLAATGGANVLLFR